MVAQHREEVNKRYNKVYWALFQRHWYAAKLVQYHEIPSKLKAKMKKTKGDSIAVHFLCDETYSLIHKSKIEPFGNTEKDESRGRRDRVGYALAKQLQLDGEDNILEPETASPKNESDKEDTRLFSKFVEKFNPSYPSRHDPNELDIILNIMVINDQQITFEH